MTLPADARDELRGAFEQHGEPGFAELWETLQELPGISLACRIASFHKLKSRVFRLTFRSASGIQSLVLKRLEPSVAQRDRFVAERWLPALGLGGCAARLLGTAALRRGDFFWHVYEDLGDETLAVRRDAARIRATVDLIAALHTRAAGHHVLPDARRYSGNLGFTYFTANVGDAIAAFETLAAAGIKVPVEFAGVTDRLLVRLVALRDDTPRRARAFDAASGPDTLLHGDVWPINVFVSQSNDGLHARMIDWDRAGVGPFSYDLSAFLFRFPPEDRSWILEWYREAVARAGWRLAPAEDLQLLFDTAERARYANCLIWPVRAFVESRAPWALPHLAEIERWFATLDAAETVAIRGGR
jgi:hypothetical protein